MITSKIYEKCGTFQNMCFNGKKFWRFQTKKRTETLISTFKKNSGIQGPWTLQLNEAVVNSTNQTKRNLKKKSFRSKLLKLSKTRDMKSSPDMFNFYVVLARPDKVSDAGRVTTCRRKFKAPSLQTKGTKIERSPENMGFNGKKVWRFQTKKQHF